MNAYTYDCDGYQTAFDTTGTSNDATYAYDADKRRIGKVVDSVTTKYFLDADTSGRKRRASSANVIAGNARCLSHI